MSWVTVLSTHRICTQRTHEHHSLYWVNNCIPCALYSTGKAFHFQYKAWANLPTCTWEWDHHYWDIHILIFAFLILQSWCEISTKCKLLWCQLQIFLAPVILLQMMHYSRICITNQTMSLGVMIMMMGKNKKIKQAIYCIYARTFIVAASLTCCDNLEQDWIS